MLMDLEVVGARMLGPPRSGAGAGVGMLGGAGADMRGWPYVLYRHSQGALCALLTFPGGPMCLIDTPRGLYVLY